MILHKASALATLLEGDLIGPDKDVKMLSDQAGPNAIVVLSDAKHISRFNSQDVAALVVDKELESSHSLIVVKDSRLALAQLSHVFNNRPRVAQGIHPSAQIHETAELADDVHIAENVVIKAGVRIASGSQIGASCVLSEQVVVGKNCTLHPNVTLYAGCNLGARVIIHSGTVLGSDGFGYAVSQQGATKIHHLGSVILEDDVEVGANSCIDRATLGETHIGARTKIDNLCQIGHNVITGTDCIIAGTVAVAGSTSLGRGVTLGGGSGVVDHVHIADGATIGARSLVTKNIPAGQTWAGYPAEPYKSYVRKHYLQNQLERIWQLVKKLPKEQGKN